MRRRNLMRKMREDDVGDEQEQDTPPSGDPSHVPSPPPFPNPNLPHTLTWAGRLPQSKCLMMQLSSNLLRISRWMFPAYGGVHYDVIGFPPHGREDGFY